MLRRAHFHEPAPKISPWHLNRFPPTSLSVGCRSGQQTFGGTHGYGRDAPKPAVRLMGRTSQTDPKPSSNHADKLGARIVTLSFVW
jgi:hypothetical protein